MMRAALVVALVAVGAQVRAAFRDGRKRASKGATDGAQAWRGVEKQKESCLRERARQSRSSRAPPPMLPSPRSPAARAHQTGARALFHQRTVRARAGPNGRSDDAMPPPDPPQFEKKSLSRERAGPHLSSPAPLSPPPSPQPNTNRWPPAATSSRRTSRPSPAWSRPATVSEARRGEGFPLPLSLAAPPMGCRPAARRRRRRAIQTRGTGGDSCLPAAARATHLLSTLGVGPPREPRTYTHALRPAPRRASQRGTGAAPPCCAKKAPPPTAFPPDPKKPRRARRPRKGQNQPPPPPYSFLAPTKKPTTTNKRQHQMHSLHRQGRPPDVQAVCVALPGQPHAPGRRPHVRGHGRQVLLRPPFQHGQRPVLRLPAHQGLRPADARVRARAARAAGVPPNGRLVPF